jgi:hypothetical protein
MFEKFVGKILQTRKKLVIGKKVLHTDNLFVHGKIFRQEKMLGYKKISY